MVQQLANKAENGFDWIDICEPSQEELAQIASQHGLHHALVNDCLQPDHLPKYETMGAYSFIIFRISTGKGTRSTDTVQGLTDKIAIFYADNFIITIHREKLDLVKNLKDQIIPQSCTITLELLNLLIYACLNTYEPVLAELEKSVDRYEEVVFLRPKKIFPLKGLYYLKRRIDLIRRILILSYEIIDIIDTKPGNVNTRETRDQYVKLQHMFDALSENIHQLLTIHFSASSQRTNEIMRVLTVFSVFFMPITFIVGVYGMNFDFMPELRYKYGYPIVMLLMGVVTVSIFIWFKRKGWL